MYVTVYPDVAYHGVPGIGVVATGLAFLATFSSSVISTSFSSYSQHNQSKKKKNSKKQSCTLIHSRIPIMFNYKNAM